jgi:tyrosinase
MTRCALLLFALLAVANAVPVVSYNWKALTRASYEEIPSDLSDSDHEDDYVLNPNLSIVEPSTTYTADTRLVLSFWLKDKRTGLNFGDTKTQWTLTSGTTTIQSKAGNNVGLILSAPGVYTLRAKTSQNGDAEVSITAKAASQLDISIWHNGDFLTLNREGVVLFAIQPSPAISKVQWNVGTRVIEGQIAAVLMAPDIATVTVSARVWDQNGGSRTFDRTVTRSSTSAPRVRHNVFNLPQEVFASYKSAVQKLKDLGVWNYFVEAHLQVAASRPMGSGMTDAHGSPAFAVWHRMMLDLYERSLMTAGLAQGYGAPYWKGEDNTAKDECMWTAEMFGARTGQVKSGFIAGWRGFGDQHSDQANWPITRSPPPELKEIGKMVKAWETLLATNSSTFPLFSTMRQAIENIHNMCHVNVGGDMNTFASPNDPVFYLVHMRSEKQFTEWQAFPRCSERSAYYGMNRWRQEAKPSDKLSPWGITVSNWMTPSGGATFSTDCSTPLCQKCSK